MNSAAIECPHCHKRIELSDDLQWSSNNLGDADSIEKILIEERKKLREQITLSVQNEYSLRVFEKDQQLCELRAQIETLRNRASVGSQQLQGEVLELAVESGLREMFPADLLEPIGKGKRGADLVQTVSSRIGASAGKICWEMKRTKSFSRRWCDKVREDQRAMNADLAVIVTMAMPQGEDVLCNIDAVWVVDFRFYKALALTLRECLLQLAAAKMSIVGSNTDELSRYFSSLEFRQRVTAVMEPILKLQADLHKEKTAINRIWSAREKNLGALVFATGNFFGDLSHLLKIEISGLDENAEPNGILLNSGPDSDLSPNLY